MPAKTRGGKAPDDSPRAADSLEHSAKVPAEKARDVRASVMDQPPQDLPPITVPKEIPDPAGGSFFTPATFAGCAIMQLAVAAGWQVRAPLQRSPPSGSQRPRSPLEHT